MKKLKTWYHSLPAGKRQIVDAVFLVTVLFLALLVAGIADPTEPLK